MYRLLKAILGLGRASIDLYSTARARFLFALLGLMMLVITSFTITYHWGICLPNILLWITVSVFALLFCSDPKVVATMESIKIAFHKRQDKLEEKDPKASQKAKSKADDFAAYLPYAMLWTSIMMLFTTTLPFGWYLSYSEALTLTLVGMMFISVIAWTSYFNWTTKTIYKKVIDKYARWGFIIVVLILLPASIVHSVTGWNLYGLLGTSKTARAMAMAKHKIDVTTDKAIAKQIKEIGNKIADNNGSEDSLTFDERAIWHEAQKKVKDESLPEKLSQIEFPSFASASPAPVYTPPPPAPAPAPIAQQTVAPPPESQTQLSGWYRICLGGACNKFDIWKHGSGIASEANFPGGGKIEFEARETSPGNLSGSLKQIGHPWAKNEEWLFDNLPCNKNQISCSGKYTDKDGRKGNIVIEKLL